MSGDTVSLSEGQELRRCAGARRRLLSIAAALGALPKAVFASAAAFAQERSGQVATIFGLSSLAVAVATGAGIDLSRVYLARQKLSEVATLTCQYSVRPSVIATATSNGEGNGFQAYVTKVNDFASSALTAQGWNASAPAGTNGATMFTATQASGSTPGTSATAMSANVQTTFLQIVNVSQVPVSTRINCQNAATAANPYLINEGFETTCATYCFKLPSGATGTSSTPRSTFPTAAGYTGSNGVQWYITGYCLETDNIGIISPTIPEGTHSAELDCDNGAGSAGNSAISTKAYLAAGSYELRYYYRARVTFAPYDPAYICASTHATNVWATGDGRTNQMNVYLDRSVNGAAPMHATADGDQLAGSNLIDQCVYSSSWVERSVKINVTTAADYWLSFAADGADNSYGAQVDSIRLCPNTCPGTLQDNFPDNWTASTSLFSDSFDLPLAVATSSTRYISSSGNLNASNGTSGLLSGWPGQSASGWATAPINQVGVATFGAQAGTQHVVLDGTNAGTTPTNRMISRSFLLDPGYYSLSYAYLSLGNFNTGINLCVAAPGSGQVFPTTANMTGKWRYANPNMTANYNTNILGVFMSNGLLVSTPIGGGALNSTTSYNNPDGTVTTTPKVRPDAVNWQAYDATAVNPVIDVCGYIDDWAWVSRTVSIKITKPGLYWLTFSANGGSADGSGPALDNVRLGVLGSPYMSNPPTSALTAIPVTAPQPGASYNNNGAFNGFSIIADPFAPASAAIN